MATKSAHDFLIFLIGGSLFAAGVFLFTNQVMVSSGLAGFGFGLGVALLFTDSMRRLRVGDDCGWWWVDAADAAAFPE